MGAKIRVSMKGKLAVRNVLKDFIWIQLINCAMLKTALKETFLPEIVNPAKFTLNYTSGIIDIVYLTSAPLTGFLTQLVRPTNLRILEDIPSNTQIKWPLIIVQNIRSMEDALIVIIIDTLQNLPCSSYASLITVLKPIYSTAETARISLTE